MDMNIEDFLKNSILIFALTMDSFMVSFSYGASRIKISFSVVAGMNLVMSVMLGTAVWIGNGFAHFIEGRTTDMLAGVLLGGMGGYQIYQSVRMRKQNTTKKTRKLNFMSGIILAVALSIDSVAVGMGAGLLEGVRWMMIAGAFLWGIFMMEIGWKLGKCCAKFYKKDLSWIGGICLLLLAFFAFW